MIRVALIILLCLSGHRWWASPLEAQGQDSTLARLTRSHARPPSLARDSIQAHAYNYLAEAYSGGKDSLAALYLDSLRWLLEKTEWKKTEGLYLRAQGKYHDRRGEFPQALDKYSQAIEYFQRIGDRSDDLAYTYILKAFVLNNNGLTDECEKTLNEIRPLAEQLPNKNFLAWILDAFGDHAFYASFGRQDILKALRYYQQVEQILPQVRNEMIKADNAHGLAGCYMRLGDEENARKYIQRALALSGENNLQSVIFAIYADLADVHESRGNFDSAIVYRNKSLEYARQTHWIEMEARAERNAAYTFKAAGDYQNALWHFEKYKTIEDSLARFSVQNKYHELEVKYETGKKDLEIQRLGTRNLMAFLYLAMFLLLGGFLFILYYRKTNQKLIRQNTQLVNKNLEIQRALTEGQNIERKRMAIELHDNINAKIAAAKWVLETINTPDKPEIEKQVIERLVESMSDIYEDVRFISHNLVPKELETKRLREIIQQLVDNLNQNQRISFLFEPEGEDLPLDPGIKLHCYAMMMELVNNVIRHSGCHRAILSLKQQTDMLLIRVEDDGKGLDTEAVKSGTGLKNLATRVRSLNGSLSIHNLDGKGTAIEIRIPVDLAVMRRSEQVGHDGSLRDLL